MQRGHPTRVKLRLLVAAIVVTGTAGTIATALTGPLATRHPLLLIVLDARNRNLILARHVGLVPFLGVGTFRRVLSDPLYWLLGWWYGDRAIRWLERKGGGGLLVTFTERVFARAAYPMVFLFPGVVVCSLAGATGMPFVPFLIVNVVGTLTTVSVLRLSGDVLGGPVDAVLGFFSRHLVATTIVTVLLVVASLVLNRLQGDSDLPPLDELEPDRNGDVDGDVDDGGDGGGDENRPDPIQPR